MSDFGSDDDIFKKYQSDEDEVKPIDIGGGNIPAPQTPSSGAPPFEASDLLKPGEEYRQEASSEMAAHMMAHGDINYIRRGDYLDLLRKDPTLKRLRIGAGWEQRALEEDKVDIDLSAFILDRGDMTRVDEDFVFYNSPSGLEGGIKHLGDSRSGAGEGDDEAFSIDLNAIPFDVHKISFVFSIYDEESKGLNFSLVRDVFLRIINEDDQNEVCRFAFENDELKGGNGCYVATLIREGPKWYIEATGQFVNGGLAEIATRYGIIVREMQSTGT